MNEVDKILKDAAKISDELYPTYGHVQTPIEALGFYRQRKPQTSSRRSMSLACACACAAVKWWNLAANSIATTCKNSYFAQATCRFWGG